MSNLPVCPKCGWHNGFSHARECNPKAGAAAALLQGQFADIESTKLGYGFGRLTFNFDRRHSVTFQVQRTGKFDLERVFWLGTLDRNKAEKVVEALFKLAKPVKR